MSDGKEPSFFAGRRVSVYFKGGRMLKDKKTDQRFWRLKWFVTVGDAEAHACGGALESTYQHMQARENAADKVELAGERGGMTARVFVSDRGEASAEVIYLVECYFTKFSMEYVGDGAVELAFELEHPLTDALHSFVKDYAFTRFGVDFAPKQMKLVAESGSSISELTKESIRRKLTKLETKGPVQ